MVDLFLYLRYGNGVIVYVRFNVFYSCIVVVQCFVYVGYDFIEICRYVVDFACDVFYYFFLTFGVPVKRGYGGCVRPYRENGSSENMLFILSVIVNIYRP